MRWRARAVAWAAVVIAVLIQGAFLSRLNIPVAITPVVVVVAAMRMTAGEAALLGFFGGLLLDLAPPSTGLLGTWALMLCVAAYLAATKQYLTPYVWWARAIFAGLLSTVAVGLVLAVDAISGRPLEVGSQIAVAIGWQLLLGTLLAALLWPVSLGTMGAPPRRRLGTAP